MGRILTSWASSGPLGSLLGFPITLTWICSCRLLVCYLQALSSHVSRACAPDPTWGPWHMVTAHREPCRLPKSGLFILDLRSFYKTL